jgi:hypothetical protein
MALDSGYQFLSNFGLSWTGPECHPTKNPDPNNLLPRGGGSFIAEVDGNLVCMKNPGSTVITIDTHGKFRGPEFAPFSFKLVPGTSDKLVDSKGRKIWTVFAEPVSEGERAAMESAADEKSMTLLKTLKDNPASSIAELAVLLGWAYQTGEPNRSLVVRLLKELVGKKWVGLGRPLMLARRRPLRPGSTPGLTSPGGTIDRMFGIGRPAVEADAAVVAPCLDRLLLGIMVKFAERLNLAPEQFRIITVRHDVIGDRGGCDPSLPLAECA